MRTALIGCTGFVGSNLIRQAHFDVGYHSTDIETIAGRRFDLIVCAGMPAEKWRANQEPDRDRASLDRLTAALGRATAGRVVLVSTVDVYPRPEEVDEKTLIDPLENHPYGRHRFMLEEFVAGTFSSTVLRLPGLFGTGLKKNVVFDLLHRRPLGSVHGAARHQYYDLSRLWADVERALTLELPVVNLATEPVAVRSIAEEIFEVPYPEAPAGAPVVSYDMRTLHARAFGGTGWYLESAEHVKRRLRDFVSRSSRVA